MWSVAFVVFILALGFNKQCQLQIMTFYLMNIFDWLELTSTLHATDSPRVFQDVTFQKKRKAFFGCLGINFQ
jgi:hypothetical protein